MNQKEQQTKSKEQVSEDLLCDIPQIVSVETFPRVLTERFALKAMFDNGEVKKYVLPINNDDEELDEVLYHDFVFTDDIWATASVIGNHDMGDKSGKESISAITFNNDFIISGILIYEDGSNYFEATKERKIVFEDETLTVEQLWTWNAWGFGFDDRTELLMMKLGIDHWEGDTIATIEGDRITSLNFSSLSKRTEDEFRVAVRNRGFGFLNPEGTFNVPPVYDMAHDFFDDYAIAKKNGRYYVVNKDGGSIIVDSKYKRVGPYFSEGLCKCTIRWINEDDIAFYEGQAGVWGFIDASGEEVIAPQYFFAENFEHGVAIVCKGKWIKKDKWDNADNPNGHYWTEEKVWGGIDKNGKEVIPFIFDDIYPLTEDEPLFMAHIGGEEDGRWGIIDKSGKWVVEPIFKELGMEYSDGLFEYYNHELDTDKFDDDPYVGIYDINQGKAIFKPQFCYLDFMQDGYIKVSVFDEEENVQIEKIIDKDGNERFSSDYFTISAIDDENVWEVTKLRNGEMKCGIIDSNGNVLVPCDYDIKTWRGMSAKDKRYFVKFNDKVTMFDFDGNVIMSGIYDDIGCLDQPLFNVITYDEQDNRCVGLVDKNGKEVLSPEYYIIRFLDDTHFMCAGQDGYVMMKLNIK